MAVEYPVVEVLPEWVSQPESMGTKEKFWYQRPDADGSFWLFKYPRRSSSGEHWSEKIAAELAGFLEIPCAQVELAVFQDEKGSTGKSFISGNQDIFHGNHILARYVPGYNPDAKRFEQTKHTLGNIWLALEQFFITDEGVEAAKLRFAEFLVLDAIIGNTDRHHENWGVVRRRDGSKSVEYLAPSFDHASSLGRELLDARRESFLATNPAQRYFEKGRGGIFWSESDQDGPRPWEIVYRAYQEYPDLLIPALSRMDRLEDSALVEAVEAVPAAWISGVARRFALAMLRYNCQKLKGLVR